MVSVSQTDQQRLNDVIDRLEQLSNRLYEKHERIESQSGLLDETWQEDWLDSQGMLIEQMKKMQSGRQITDQNRSWRVVRCED